MRILLFVGLTCMLSISTASAHTWWVDPGGAGDALTIQAGIDSASAGDTVLVACGTYYAHDIEMRSGVCLRSETGEAGCVTIDAQYLGKVIVCRGLDQPVSIAGFTLTGGEARGDYPENCGGGMHCYHSPVDISDVIFEGNRASGLTGEYVNGGGLFVYGSTAGIVDCTFGENEAGEYGGGVSCAYCSPVLEACEFNGNSCGLYGGGLCLINCPSVEVVRCIFSGNHSAGDYGSGGAVCCSGWFTPSSPGFTDCTFFGNSAGVLGGALSILDNTSLDLMGCTIVGNSAGVGGSALAVARDSRVTVENTIVSLCSGPPTVTCDPTSSITVSCTNVFGNPGGDWTGCIAGQYPVNGNLCICPAFCHSDLGDFRLCSGSPCLPGNHPDGYACGLIGAWGEGCSCGPSATEPTTWGGIKSRYR